jgi:RNA polymerase sigma factor (sigma-70 family)
MIKDNSKCKVGQMVLGNRSYVGNGKKLDVSDVLKNIIQTIRKYQPLEKEVENSLIERYQNGDIEAGQKVILHNQSIVYQLAKDYGKNDEEVRDYTMEGNFGLYEALKRFDCSKNLKFYTYARWWIMAAMTKYASTDNALIKVPDYAGAVRCARRLERTFILKEGREPTVDELKEMVESIKSETTGKMKYDVPHVEMLYNMMYISTDSPVTEDDGDFLVEESSEFQEKTQSFNDYEEKSEDEYNKAVLRPLLNYLHKDDRELMLKLYQIGKYKEVTRQQICDEYGYEPQELDLFEQRLLEKMRIAAKKMKAKEIAI